MQGTTGHSAAEAAAAAAAAAAGTQLDGTHCAAWAVPDLLCPRSLPPSLPQGTEITFSNEGRQLITKVRVGSQLVSGKEPSPSRSRLWNSAHRGCAFAPLAVAAATV